MTECVICQDSITEATGFTQLSCSHKYHLGCIVKWLPINESCPCCRKTLTEYETMKETPTDPIADLLNDISNLGSNTGEDDIGQLAVFEQFIENLNIQLHLPPHILQLPLST
jgi:hypothetical protein